MGLITKEVEVGLGGINIKYFENKGYDLPKVKDKYGRIAVPKGIKIKVKVEDLQDNSIIMVNVKCDCPACENPIKSIEWRSYLKNILKNEKYYCNSCATNLFAIKKTNETKLKNGKSFEQWCIENNKQDILNLWDYELNNNIKPNEVNYRSKKKYYFKCSRRLHKSELKNIGNFTYRNNNINCNQCNSFAQWGIDNINSDFLDKYWDYEKNNELGINPWEISKRNDKKVYIFCQEKDYHESYPISCTNFVIGNRCSYCSNKRVHLLDSLGTLHPEVLNIWSDRNKKSPYEYTSNSGQDVYWKCPNGKHDDYKRDIHNSNTRNFHCPDCQHSKGEEKITNYFINKGLIKISQEDFDKLNDIDKYDKIYYIPQKKYKNLIGINGGLLSYDFHIPKYNLLYEYNGVQHEKYTPWIHRSEKDFEKQLIHDQRKCIYAENNNINLITIWYWDYNNIEKILDRNLY